MELSNPNLQSSDFSLLNASDSQTQNPSFSLLIPSEPPELGHWFPSYEYESPVLDSSDDFRDSVSEEKEVQKDQFLISDDKRGIEDSLRGIKEIGKKDEVFVGDDNAENQSSSETIDSYCSPSPPSEPIDMKNWFSSYVYESPTLDTSDGFNDSLNKKSECEEDGLIVDESSREKVEGYVEFKRTRIRDDIDSSNRLINCGNYSKYNKQEKQRPNKDDPGSREGKHILSDKSSICLESTAKQCSNYEALQNHGIDSAKEIELSSLDQEDPRLTPKFSQDIGIVPLNMKERTSRGDRKLSEKLMCNMENVEDSKVKGHKEADGRLSPGSNQKLVLVNESTRKSIHGCKDKENDGQEISIDGFVTTRKGRLSEENAENRQEILKETCKWKVSQPGGGDSVVQRKVLSERTNFHLSGEAEITGKWQCPQKRKPNLGPPMKQLRLERWIQRA